MQSAAHDLVSHLPPRCPSPLFSFVCYPKAASPTVFILEQSRLQSGKQLTMTRHPPGLSAHPRKGCGRSSWTSGSDGTSKSRFSSASARPVIYRPIAIYSGAKAAQHQPRHQSNQRERGCKQTPHPSRRVDTGDDEIGTGGGDPSSSRSEASFSRDVFPETTARSPDVSSSASEHSSSPLKSLPRSPKHCQTMLDRVDSFVSQSSSKVELDMIMAASAPSPGPSRGNSKRCFHLDRMDSVASGTSTQAELDYLMAAASSSTSVCSRSTVHSKKSFTTNQSTTPPAPYLFRLTSQSSGRCSMLGFGLDRQRSCDSNSSTSYFRRRARRIPSRGYCDGRENPMAAVLGRQTSTGSVSTAGARTGSGVTSVTVDNHGVGVEIAAPHGTHHRQGNSAMWVGVPSPVTSPQAQPELYHQQQQLWQEERAFWI